MANTNSPQFNTYKTVYLPFNKTTEQRDGDLENRKDSYILNMYYDYDNNKDKQNPLRLKKRPGLVNTEYNLSKGSSSNAIRGNYYNVNTNTFYWAVSNKVYSVSPDVGTTVRTVATLNTSSGYVGFTDFLKSDNTRYVIFSDGTDLWVDNYAATSCARVTDADMPTPHIPYPVYLDGYIFLADASSGDIYNSNNDDPTLWTAGDFINAEMSADYINVLIRIKNYILVMGYDSIEYFYDAGIATGSPLQRNDSPFQSFGTLGGVCTLGNLVIFVGHQKNQNLGVYAINDFKINRISTDIVERSILPYSNTINDKSRLTLSVNAHAMSIDGHHFYVLNCSNTTWVYDIAHSEWYEWANNTNAPLNIEAIWNMRNGQCYTAIANNDLIQFFSTAAYADNGINFNCIYRTEKADFGTKNWKYIHRLFLDVNQHATTGTSNVEVTWSDNDWADAGTSARNINIFSVSPFISRLGRTRSRSFQIRYRDNYPFFIKGFYLDINVGQH
jgi:hypothetical protein